MIKIYESVNDGIPVYLNTHFNIDSGYRMGSGWADVSIEDRFEFYDEIRWLFETNGFEIEEPRMSGGCPTAYKPGTEEHLYLHPMELTGPVLKNDIPKIERMLQNAKTFEVYRVDTYEELHDMSDSEYRGYLENNREAIEQDILNMFTTRKFTPIYFFGDTPVYDKWHLSRTVGGKGKSSSDVDIMFFEEVLDDLVEDGKLIKDDRYNKYKLVR